jgi:hypothetical protein
MKHDNVAKNSQPTSNNAVNKVPTRSFAEVVHDSCEIQISQLSCPIIKGDL